MTREEMLEGFDKQHALFGLLFSVANRLQAAVDSFYEEITCKQFFLLISLNLFRDQAPTINELSDMIGSSHQNVKQIVIKLEKAGFIRTFVDEKDKRKIRVVATSKVNEISEKYSLGEQVFFKALYDGVSEEDIAVTLKTATRMEYNLMQMKTTTNKGGNKYERNSNL